MYDILLQIDAHKIVLIFLSRQNFGREYEHESSSFSCQVVDT